MLVDVGAHRFYKRAESLSSAESLAQECWGGQVALGGSMHYHFTVPVNKVTWIRYGR